MFRSLAFLTAFVLICPGRLSAGDAVPQPPLTATWLPHTLVIDGKLDDEAWTHVPWTAEFQAFKDGKPPRSPGRAKIAWDFRCLYFAFECKDSDIQAKVRERDGPMWEDDTFEIFLDASGRADHYLEIGVNAENCIHDYLVIRRDAPGDPGRFTDITLTRMKTAVDKTKDGWSVEVAIPWREIQSAPHLPPRKGQFWRINFLHCNRDADGATAATLAPLAATHDPRNFLPLAFDQTALDSIRTTALAAAAQALKDYDHKKSAWRLGEHLDDVKVISSRLGPLPKKEDGYIAQEGWGRVATRKQPVTPEGAPKDIGPAAVLTVHPTDAEFPETFDTVWVLLPKLDTEKIALWYRMEPTKAKALASGLGDGIGVSLEVQEPVPGNDEWRKLAEVHVVATQWSLREIAVPNGANLRLAIDRGPATSGYDMGEIGLEAAPPAPPGPKPRD